MVEEKQLRELYIDKKLSIRACAEVLGLPSHGGLSCLLKKYNIKPRPSGFQKGNDINKGRSPEDCAGYKGGKIKKVCACGKEFEVFPSQSSAYTRCDECKTKPRSDISGMRFGELIAIKPVLKQRSGRWLWECKCSCGDIKIVAPCDLKAGLVKSCGCKRSPTGADSPVYLDGGVGFDRYAPNLLFAEPVRRDLENDKILNVKCAYCGKWFRPSRAQAVSRVEALQSRGGENRFYCSTGCKEACPTYRKKLWPKGFKSATSREVVPELRQIVFKRDGWECQRCGSIDQLHCHHIQGYAQNKMLANDPDNCITLCKKCHKKVHKIEGCEYHNLQCNQTRSNTGF